MPRTSVQHVKRKYRLSSKDLTRLIRKKAYGATVVYSFGNSTIQIGWHAHFTNKPNIFIGRNWVKARDFIAQMPIDSILKYLIPDFILTSFKLKGDVL